MKDFALIAFDRKGGIWIDGSMMQWENKFQGFKKGYVIGIGIIHCPANPSLKCFVTYNGKLHGKFRRIFLKLNLNSAGGELPPKFTNLILFPAVNMYYSGESIRANFGKKEWRFKEFKEVLE